MAEGIHVFDKPLQEANIWVKEIGEEFGGDTQRAYHALRATLHALRNRITLGEAAQLGDQLPTLVKGIYYDQWRPSEQPERYRSREEFLEEVGKDLQLLPPTNAETAAKAVFRCLQHHCDPGEIADVKGMLPEPILTMWPQ
jgi:uncharacterized protein (DUF2267 family)